MEIELFAGEIIECWVEIIYHSIPLITDDEFSLGRTILGNEIRKSVNR